MKETEPRLPKLYTLAFILHCASFALFAVPAVILVFHFFSILSLSEKDLTLQKALPRENMVLFLCALCGHLTERPTHWLVQFAESPRGFFDEIKNKEITRYAPISWFIIWIAGVPATVIILAGIAYMKNHPWVLNLTWETLIQYYWIPLISFTVSFILIYVVQFYQTHPASADMNV